MYSLWEHRIAMAEEPFEHETNNIPQGLYKDSKDGINLYRWTKAKITIYIKNAAVVKG